MNLYVVRNREGKFFRSIGYGGSGTNWVDSLEKAKFYAKIGQAKARVTYFAKQWPQFGTPEILEFTLDVSEARVIDMVESTKKSIVGIRRRELLQEQRQNGHRLEELQRNRERLEQEIREMSRDVKGIRS